MIWVLCPVALLLFLTGFVGFIYARNIMLDQWKEAAILKLGWAAHQVDMRLEEPVQWLSLLRRIPVGGGLRAQEHVLEELRSLDGVQSVDLEWSNESSMFAFGGRHMGGRMMSTQDRVSVVTPPELDPDTGSESVTLVSELLDEQRRIVGRVLVTVQLHHLIADLVASSWWQGVKGCLVDASGRYLAHTSSGDSGRRVLGGSGSPLEARVLQAMKERPSGTIFGEGHPPEEVAGFFRLKQAPWSVVVFAQGDEILKPIIRFRNYFGLLGALCIGMVLFLIQYVSSRTVRSIREIALAAERVAEGDYGETVKVRTSDEVGRLAAGFNAMVESLRQQEFIRTTFGRYMDREVAEKLLRRPESTRLGGEKRRVFILMSDLRGFTALCERMEPETVITVLNRYYSRMIQVVRSHEGIIVDFIGDAMLVFFDPLDAVPEDRSLDAVRCALDMQVALDMMNELEKVPGLPSLSMGIGVHTGEVIVGNVGSEIRAKYGIVGAAVNLTQRIQTEAREGEVVVSEAVLESVRDYVKVLRPFEANVKGVTGALRLYAVGSMEVRDKTGESSRPY